MTGQTAHLIHSAPTQHLGQIFFNRASELADRTFVKIQRGGDLEEISWGDFGMMVRNTILGLYALGLHKGDPVALIGENSLTWVCADLATLAAGLPNVVVSASLSDGALLKILSHSRCRAVFVEDAERLMALKKQLPQLSHVIILNDAAGAFPGTIAFAQLLEQGQPCDIERLNEILESVQPDDLATIMYTSGSTGEPKGVMRTQDNLLSNITNGGEIVLSKGEELTVIVLSLNHLLGRYGFLKSAVTGRTTAIIESTELDIDLGVVQALRPTAMCVVPRVMERIFNKILEMGSNREMWARFEKLKAERRETHLKDSDDARLVDHLKTSLREAARQALGGRIKYVSYGGAAMPPGILRFFEVIGVPLIGSYGSTECGGVTLCGIGDAKPGSLGKPFPNVELTLAEDGEILVRGPTVTPGYFENEEATREAFDAEGWFRTGDLGRMDSDGALYIVGRKKDIFYCADGSNIYPGRIELLLENDSFIRQAVLLGDHRPFVAALIVPERSRIAAALAGSEATLRSSDIEAALWGRIDEVNSQLEHYEKIRRIAVVPNDFPQEVRNVTAFQKIKIDRHAIEERYRREIQTI